ncbi:hypothetical protein V2A60_003366 [Cordyceps javanica]|uniref:Uncharacterized protein n=1 Tax=Cordyceps javanica TaxID=43265 RepID=A0A545V3B2_9HYPO|nr:hypothetical protein IF1G_04779 [Cordyceps javanica]TQW07498.1 hypothetical protein IF2G_04659 [Cordyceps javanica]
MLSYLLNAFTPSTNTSVLLVLGKFGSTIHNLHFPSENGVIERFSFTSPSTAFRYGGATEQAREQIGTVTLHVGDGETPDSFLDDVEARIRKLWDDSSSSSLAQQQTGTVGMTQLVQDILKPAARDAIDERETLERSMNATQAYSVYIIYIRRPTAGTILREPTSFPP